jgi:hypothetical protein
MKSGRSAVPRECRNPLLLWRFSRNSIWENMEFFRPDLRYRLSRFLNGDGILSGNEGSGIAAWMNSA